MRVRKNNCSLVDHPAASYRKNVDLKYVWNHRIYWK